MRSAIVVALFTAASSFAVVTPFSLKDMKSGEIYNSANHPGSVFLLESYFLNCPYCNDNAPNVDSVANFFESEGRVQVLDVGVDRSDAQYAEWIRRHHPNHPVLNDGARTLTRKLGTSNYPTSYVVDSSGNILLRTVGVWSESTKARILQTISNALAQMDEDESEHGACLQAP
ncbi:MAG: TlpA family protein disulfide reductase [Deltaproteobacteria bacterium]|nr:TlpA family protein disulfide reductase [Deltaproteobacteria bacterium]MBI3294331.1 TlpA family protein disulfide reductase [Deltaproteobacteria bacterium]